MPCAGPGPGGLSKPQNSQSDTEQFKYFRHNMINTVIDHRSKRESTEVMMQRKYG